MRDGKSHSFEAVNIETASVGMKPRKTGGRNGVSGG